MYKITERIQSGLRSFKSLPFYISKPQVSFFLEMLLVFLAICCLVFGSYIYIASVSPDGFIITRNVQAALNQLSSLIPSPSKDVKPNNTESQKNAPSLELNQASDGGENSTTVNQYISSSSITDQKVRDIVTAFLKAGSNVSLTESDGYLSVNSSTSSTITTTTVSLGDSGITVPFSLANGGTGGATAADARTNLGLIDGGAGDIWVNNSGDTVTGQLLFSNSLTGNTIRLTPTGDSGFLNSSGGVIFINNTSNPGSGVGIYSNAGASALGNMINVKVDNSAYNQAAFFMDYDGVSNAVEINANTNDLSSNALAVSSNNSQDSTVGIIGHENGRGTIKISHFKNDGFSDANASGISIDLRNSSLGEQTAAQGLYIDSTEVGGTTGNLLRLRNQTIDRFVVNASGSLQVGASGSDTTITKLGNNSNDQFFVGTNGAFRVQRSAGNSEAFRVQVSGDSQGRWLGTSDGQLKWGPGGSTTQDTVMSRTGIGLLALQGAIVLNNTNGDFDNVIKGQTDSNLLYADASTDRIGLGIAAPTTKLHVVGDIRVTGGYTDSSNSLGSNGYILTSTASGTAWVNSSTIIGNAFIQGGNSFGANTILGTDDAFPLILETAGTEALRIDTSRNVGIGTSTITTRLNVLGADLDGTQTDQALGISNMAVNLTKNDANTRTYYGFQIKPTINAGASNTTTTFNILNVDTVNTATTGVTRNLLRLADGGTTRFLVQSGGNLVATATTTGGTAYQYNFDSITSGNGVLLSVNALQGGIGLGVTSSSAAMSGQLSNIVLSGNNANNTGTLLRVASTGASNTGTVGMFSNAGSGLSFRVNDDGTDTDSTAVVVDNNGSLGIGSTAPAQPLDVEGLIQTDLGTSQSSVALCHSGVAAAGTNNDVNIVDCTGTITADYMEMYSVDNGVAMGDIVMPGSTYITTTNGHRVAKLTKAAGAYQKGIIGIVSNKNDAGDFNSIGYNIKDQDNPQPVALNGRVKVKIAQSSSAIEPGDYITSSNESGKGMKAIQAGYMVGKALESWAPGQEYVMVFVANTYADPMDILAKLSIDENGFITSPKIIANQISLGQSQTDLSTSLDNQSTEMADFKTKTNNRLRKVDDTIATMAAALAQINTSSIKDVAGIVDPSNLEQRTRTLETEVASLSAKLTDAVLGVSTGSSSASLASNSASLDGLLVSGNTNLNNLGVTGTISAGLLTIEGLDSNGQAAINTLSGTLKLQSTGTGGIDILNGKIVIESSGNIFLKDGSLKGNDSSRGFNLSVKENDTSVEIKFNKPKSDTNYAVSILPSWITQSAIESKTADGFTIKFSTAAPAGAKIDWIVAE